MKGSQSTQKGTCKSKHTKRHRHRQIQRGSEPGSEHVSERHARASDTSRRGHTESTGLSRARET